MGNIKEDTLLPREKLKESVTRPSPSNSSRVPIVGVLPEALDRSEEGTVLVLSRVLTEDEGLASTKEPGRSSLANCALESESNLLGLLSEDGLSLTTESGLLGPIATSALSLL